MHLSPGLPLRSCPGYLPPHSRAPATSQGQVLGGQGGCRGCAQREWTTMVPWAPGKPNRTLHPALGWRSHMLSQPHHVWAPVLSVGPRGSLRPRGMTWAGPRCVRRHCSTSLCAAGPRAGGGRLSVCLSWVVRIFTGDRKGCTLSLQKPPSHQVRLLGGPSWQHPASLAALSSRPAEEV